MGKRLDHPPILPLGYLLLNGVGLAVLVAVYFASVYYGRAMTFISTGLFPILATCWIALLVASTFDYIWEKNVPRRTSSPLSRKGDSRGSRDGTRKSD